MAIRPSLTPDTRTGFEVFRDANPEFVEAIAQMRSYRRGRLALLARLGRRKQRSLARAILNDPRLHGLYAYEALRRSDRLREATVEQIEELAQQANLFDFCRERHQQRFVRSGRRQREVISFGPQKRMRQMLAGDVIRALHPPHSSQTLFRGGMPAARRAVDAAFFEHGMRYCVEVDFINFYGSIPWEGLADTLRPLPSGVVRHVLWDLTIRRDGQGVDFHSQSPVVWSDPTRIGPIGLPLGSASSPAVGECILAQFLREIPDGRAIAYADNIMLLGESEAEVLLSIERLREAVRNSRPVRQRAVYSLRESAVTPLERGFRFLGQEATVPDDDDAVGFSWEPCAEKIAEYRVGEWGREASERELADTERKVINWRRAYPDWQGGKETEALCLAEIACMRYLVRPTGVLHRRAVNAVLRAMLEDGYATPVDQFVPDIAPQHAERRYQLVLHIDQVVGNAVERVAEPV